jgi:N-acetylglucosaminyl-diphospho-decaprenol L-rhamnosyltransferase
VNQSSNAGDVAVVIVAYRSASTIRACIESVRDRDAVAEVVVVDNSSPDDSAAIAGAAGASVISAPNRGFGAGCNVGAAATSSPYVLFLNPDAIVTGTTVDRLRQHLAMHPEAAAVASELRAPDGRPEPSCRRRPSIWRTPLEPGLAGDLDTRYYRRRLVDGGAVDWVAGACFLVRRDAFAAVGGFDESYFLYAEEADLCARLRQAGWSIEWVPGSVTIHRSGHSTSSLDASGKLAWVDGWMRYTVTHHRHPRALRLGLLTGLYGRVAIWTILRRPEQARMWRSVARHLVRCSSHDDRPQERPPETVPMVRTATVMNGRTPGWESAATRRPATGTSRSWG